MKYILLSLSMILCNCTTQMSSENKMILGKWKSDKRIIIYDGDTTSVIDDLSLQHIFFSDTTWFGFSSSQGHETYNYTVNGNKLTINGQSCEILKLDDKRLIIRTQRSDKDRLVVDSFVKAQGFEW